MALRVKFAPAGQYSISSNQLSELGMKIECPRISINGKSGMNTGFTAPKSRTTDKKHEDWGAYPVMRSVLACDLRNT